MSVQSKLNRRDFLKLAGLGAAGAALAACAPSAPPPAPTAPPAAAPKAAEPTKAPEPTKAAEPTKAPAAPAPTATPAVTAVPAAKDAVPISYWHIWGGVRVDQLQSVLNDFMIANPKIKVEPLLLPNPGYADKILTGLAADPPDLTMIYTDEFAPSAKRNALKPVDDLMKTSQLSQDIWLPGVYNMSVWQGKTYGLPFVGNFLQMVYWNKDDLKGAGMDPEKGPATWTEMLDLAKKLTKVDASGKKVERLGYVPGGSGEWSGGAYRNAGGFLGDGTPEKVAINSDASIEALQFTVDLYKAMGGWDAVGATTTGWGNQQLGNPMIAGVASAILSNVFTVNIINQQKPTLPYKIGKVHKSPKGEYLDIITASWSNAIPAKAKRTNEAWELAKYLSAGEGHRKFMVDLQARPAMVKKYNEAPYDAAARKSNPYWDIVLEILNGKQVAYPVSDKLGAASKVITEAFESVMLDKRSVKDGAAFAQAEVVKLFKES
jgi:ABC-type glycerol-3-phosphate transport system substrate-binding protein